MNAKTTDCVHPAEKVSRRMRASLAHQIELRSDDYLQYCVNTLPSENRHTIWSRLYAACRRLSQAVREDSVADAVVEIASNFMACEEIAIVKCSPEISFLATVGISFEQRRSLISNSGRISEELSRRNVRIVDPKVEGDKFLASLGITALVSLTHDHAIKGAIVFFGLLPQHSGFESGDRELLGLFSIYLGPCLFGL
jgi:hypothetical protein